jgi:nitroreductase
MSNTNDAQNYPNSTIETLLKRRTIRAFKPTPISDERRRLLELAAQHAPTSSFDNAWSAIRVTEGALAAEIAEIGRQKYIATAPLLYVFVVDMHRNERIAREKGATVDGGALAFAEQYAYNQAHDDVVLALDAMKTAAESLGLGAVVLGSILNDMPRLIELLHLPSLVFPVLGLAVGEPDQEPALKPRMNRKFQIFENRYPSDSQTENLTAALADFDEAVHQYYDLRDRAKPVDRFTDQIAAKAGNPAPATKPFAKYAKEQGFRF